jgi:hypothetical protein
MMKEDLSMRNVYLRQAPVLRRPSSVGRAVDVLFFFDL